MGETLPSRGIQAILQTISIRIFSLERGMMTGQLLDDQIFIPHSRETRSTRDSTLLSRSFFSLLIESRTISTSSRIESNHVSIEKREKGDKVVGLFRTDPCISFFFFSTRRGIAGSRGVGIQREGNARHPKIDAATLETLCASLPRSKQPSPRFNYEKRGERKYTKLGQQSSVSDRNRSIFRIHA